MSNAREEVQELNAQAVKILAEQTHAKLNEALEKVQTLSDTVSAAISRVTAIEREMILLKAMSRGKGPTHGDHS